MQLYQEEETTIIRACKKLESERLTPFPAVTNVQNPSIQSTNFERHGDHRHATESTSVTSWAKAFHSLARSTMSVSSPSKNKASGMNRKMADMGSIPRSLRRTPVLTMTLLKLHDVFDEFCHHLIDATHSNVHDACMVLDSAPIAVSPRISAPSSPDKVVDSPSSHGSSSPSRSPIASWFTGPYSSESYFPQKSEWERHCNPLIIFAGLEATYSACSHFESRAQALALMRRYEGTIDELRLIRETLCEPFVYSMNDDSLPCSNLISSYKEKATTLALSIEAIMSLCECRCKLIEQQTILYSSEKLDVEKLIASFRLIHQNMPKNVSKSICLVQSVSQEVEAWLNITKTYVSLEKYRFLNTVVGCQKIKLKLNTSSETRIKKCMSKIYQSFVSLLPIYFESVGLDILSRYGFQESGFAANSGGNGFGEIKDLEAKLEEFLRYEERIGAAHLAIAVVADVASFHLLRSKSDHISPTKGTEKWLNINRFVLEPDDVLSAFPAIYLRTTADRNLSSNVRGSRRNSGKRDNNSAQIMERSPSKGSKSRIERNSWPYTSWDSIIQVLKKTVSLTPAAEEVETNWTQVDSESSVFASAIHKAMWFVAIKKIHNDDRWNRRNDEEQSIKEQQFFSDFSTSLRLRDVFKSNMKILDFKVDPLLNELSHILVGDGSTDGEEKSRLSDSFKRILGLRLPSCKYSKQFPIQNIRKGLAMPSSKYPSHYAFFLGSHLMDSLGDE